MNKDIRDMHDALFDIIVFMSRSELGAVLMEGRAMPLVRRAGVRDKHAREAEVTELGRELATPSTACASGSGTSNAACGGMP
jgi:hypothetical protein